MARAQGGLSAAAAAGSGRRHSGDNAAANHALIKRIRDGDTSAAYAALHGLDEDQVQASEHFRRVRYALARALVSDVDQRIGDLVIPSLDATGVCRADARSIIIDHGVLHIIQRGITINEGFSKKLMTVCGQQWTFDVADPVQQARRGDWQRDPKDSGLHRCPDCAVHADQFDETYETPGAVGSPEFHEDSILGEVMDEASEELNGQLLQELPREKEQDLAEAAYRASLHNQLAKAAKAAGESSVRELLGEYYDRADDMLSRTESPHVGRISELVSEQDWQNMVGVVFADVEDATDACIARAFLHHELRIHVGESLHRAQQSAAESAQLP